MNTNNLLGIAFGSEQCRKDIVFAICNFHEYNWLPKIHPWSEFQYIKEFIYNFLFSSVTQGLHSKQWSLANLAKAELELAEFSDQALKDFLILMIHVKTTRQSLKNKLNRQDFLRLKTEQNIDTLWATLLENCSNQDKLKKG